EIRAHENPRWELFGWLYRNVDLAWKLTFALGLDRQGLHPGFFKKPVPNEFLRSECVADLVPVVRAAHLEMRCRVDTASGDRRMQEQREHLDNQILNPRSV